MNRITIELCHEDRARLDGILAALELLGHTKQYACPVEEAPEAPAPQPDIPEAPIEEPEPIEEPVKEEAPAYKLADLQQKVVSLSAAGKKAEVKAIITQYAYKVSDIPAEKYGEVMAQLTALEG